jgi:hypothetical protein
MNDLNQEIIDEITNTANHMIQNEMGHLNIHTRINQLFLIIKFYLKY